MLHCHSFHTRFIIFNFVYVKETYTTNRGMNNMGYLCVFLTGFVVGTHEINKIFVPYFPPMTQLITMFKPFSGHLKWTGSSQLEFQTTTQTYITM